LLAGYLPPTAEEKAAKPPARHRLVQYHSGAGAKTLYLAAHISHIVDWPDEKSRALPQELMTFATQPGFTCAVRWQQPGDMVIWDNRSTLHRATAFEDRLYARDMRRTAVFDRVS
jgi:alpha-ketoglutarate-dependent 2,4-dichlorophenoxyacetate dioxygenase